MSAVTDAQRLAHVGLSRVVEPGSWALHREIASRGVEEVWHRVRAGARVGQLDQGVLGGIAARLEGYDPRRDLERVGDVGGRVVVPGDDEWPEQLTWDEPDADVKVEGPKDTSPPHVLYVRGGHDVARSTERSVAVVGSRAASPYGLRVATELGLQLAEAGWSVVSGGAFGVDAAAHRGALAAAESGRAAPTVAVLACGVDVAYPRGNGRMLSDLYRDGLVLTEHPPGASVTRLRFLVRNRLIAGLSRGTVVVESANRGGSLSTANHAVRLERHLMAVPGPVTSAVSAGCHTLVREGKAVLVTGTPDVLELVGRMGEYLPEPQRGPVSPRDELDEQARRVLDAVPLRRAAGIGSIGRTAGLSAMTVQVVLPRLLVKGLVEQRDGAWRLTPLAMGR